MKLYNTLKYTILLLLISGCTQAGNTISNGENELLKFAKANCFFWYFKKKNYDLKDIRAITGGIVEMGTYSAEKYQSTALLVKEYNPQIRTKQNIDVDLYKCFILEADKQFINKINKLK